MKSTRPSAIRASAARPALVVGFGTPPASGAETHSTKSVSAACTSRSTSPPASSPTSISVAAEEDQHRRVALGERDPDVAAHRGGELGPQRRRRGRAARRPSRRRTGRPTSRSSTCMGGHAATVGSGPCARCPWLARARALRGRRARASAPRPRRRSRRSLLERCATTPADAADVVLAVPAALAFALAAALARRWVPDPWATRGGLLVALSPLGFALGSGVAAGRARRRAARRRPAARAARPRRGDRGARPRRRRLPRAGAVVRPRLRARVRAAPARAGARGPRGAGGRLLGAARARGRRRVGGGARRRRHAAGARGHPRRRHRARSGASIVDVLRWAPLLALAFVGAYLLLRSRRERVSRAIPARRDAEVAAALTGIDAAGAARRARRSGRSAPGAGVPLAAALRAWGLQRVPRVGASRAGRLALTAWMIVALANGDAGGWLDVRSSRPVRPAGPR